MPQLDSAARCAATTRETTSPQQPTHLERLLRQLGLPLLLVLCGRRHKKRWVRVAQTKESACQQQQAAQLVRQASCPPKRALTFPPRRAHCYSSVPGQAHSPMPASTASTSSSGHTEMPTGACAITCRRKECIAGSLITATSSSGHTQMPTGACAITCSKGAVHSRWAASLACAEARGCVGLAAGRPTMQTPVPA